MLSKECIEYVQAHLHEQPSALLLRDGGRQWPFSLKEAVVQVECRRKCRSKLARFLEEKSFRFADLVCAEQASHEHVARYHAALAGGGISVIDMTAGLGIDSMSMAMAGASVTAIELDAGRASALCDNALTMGASSLKVVCGDSVEWLGSSAERSADVIFIDPARRDSAGKRAYGFSDCVPDLLAIRPLLLARSRRLLVKASPLLDVTQVLREVPETTVVRAVSVAGECKELLLEARAEGGDCMMVAVDIDREGNVKEFAVDSQACVSQPEYVDYHKDIAPGMYLYEPSASVMKLAPWGALSERFAGLRKLGSSTHLYLGDRLHEDFPGRVLIIEATPQRAALKSLKGERINVVTRNYPLPAPQLEKKLGVRPAPSAERFIYGLRAGSTPCLVVGSVAVR